ncbi:nucleotidyl transferase AbiEii/AbiGii toxin family protein [Candidatus Microgenomates bacterium]|nr:nucleotidyl transferase AbiEii/AbiGii toxin family protein [Candidatus Microgenomates bacterium]
MNNITANFDQILEFAQSYNLPLTKKRAILREYLQTKVLDIIYREKISVNIFFVGGTSLRLLRGLDRFSEDLDFDVKASPSQVKKLIQLVSKSLKQESIKHDLYQNITSKRAYYELRFKNLLYDLNISRNQSEKLMVKLDFADFWHKQKREVILLNRYGFLVNVVTIGLNQFLVQKFHAYLNRKQTLPRDMYDLVWLMGQQAHFDHYFAKANRLSADMIDLGLQKYLKEKKQLKNYKQKLRPFLINEKNIDKLDFFPQVIKNSSKIA